MVLVFKIDKLFENLYHYYIVTKSQKAWSELLEQKSDEMPWTSRTYWTKCEG